jgi:hypothetical protein
MSVGFGPRCEAVREATVDQQRSLDLAARQRRSCCKIADLMTFIWPRLTKVLSAWGIATLCACGAFVLHARSLPADDLLMASTLGFQVMTSLLMVALPSPLCLFVFLGMGAIVKGWLAGQNIESMDESLWRAEAVRLPDGRAMRGATRDTVPHPKTTKRREK